MAQALLEADKPVAAMQVGQWTGLRGHWSLSDLQAL